MNKQYIIISSLVFVALSFGLSAGTKKPTTPCDSPEAMKSGSCDMVLVPSGEFWMGCNAGVDNQCDEDELPYHKVNLGDFYVDKYEVTVEQYGACVDAGKCTKPSMGGYCNWGKDNRENHPINCIDWEQANQFCGWLGKRLPTEAEWEKAARGTDGRKFPWGNQAASCNYAVINENSEDACGKKPTWPVGSKPAGASPYGVMDMAGNVWEWVADWYDEGYYKNSPSNNPQGPKTGHSRVQRGGSWYYPAYAMRAAYREEAGTSGRDDDDGFRCAKTK